MKVSQLKYCLRKGLATMPLVEGISSSLASSKRLTAPFCKHAAHVLNHFCSIFNAITCVFQFDESVNPLRVGGAYIPSRASNVINIE